MNENSFYQFTHDGTTPHNKCKYQAFGIQFTDAKFRNNNVISLSFKKPLSHKAKKVAELAEESFNEYFDIDFTDVFLSSVQDLDASAVSKELNAEKVECDMHQGYKVVASDVG